MIASRYFIVVSPKAMIFSMPTDYSTNLSSLRSTGRAQKCSFYSKITFDSTKLPSTSDFS